MDATTLTAVVFEVTALQVLLFIAARRCSSEQLPFWRGALITAASMRTGWIYLDIVIAGAAVTILLLVAGCLVFTPNPPHLYHRVVYSFYSNRMEQ
jgi:hypothetical protein